ncbi:MAG: hypothetical protein JWN62_2450 [Acidimicrobiales bacterium]|nr:hypothetical protein [Acidimicrobiales bacterium]
MATKIRSIVASALLASSAIAVTSLASGLFAQASGPAVTVHTDGGAGSLRAAVNVANSSGGAHTIQLGAGKYSLTLTGAQEDGNVSGDLDVLQPLTITGLGSGQTFIDAKNITDRVLHVLGNGQLTLVGVTVQNGNGVDYGGGIDIDNHTRLTLTDVDLIGNSASQGGGVSTGGPFSIHTSTFAGNSASQVGNAIQFNSIVGGLTLIESSTFNANHGGSGTIVGIGLPLVISDTTISENTANKYPGLWAQGGTPGTRRWTLDHVTIADNVGGVTGGGIAVAQSGEFALVDSLIVRNTGAECSVTTPYVSGATVVSDSSCAPASFNVLTLGNADPGLSPLMDNGGPARTQALTASSAAVNITTCDPGELDERGFPRPTNTQRCDAGAYERSISPVADSAIASSNTAKTISVFANDLGADGNTLLASSITGGSFAVSTPPAHGTAQFAGHDVVYTSNVGFGGADGFDYTVCVAQECHAAHVTVTVAAPAVLGAPPGGNGNPANPADPANISQFVPIAPFRLLDTRQGTKPVAGSTTSVLVLGVNGIPTSGVTAVVLNITATEATAPGYVSVFPTGQAQPVVSSLNLEYAGETIPNLVTVPIGADGTVSLFTQSGTHLIADISGYYRPFTDQKSGRFIPLTPTRLLDTRTGGTPLAAQKSTDLVVTNVGGVPSAASAVVVNVTATDALDAGYVTVWPAGIARPVVSNLNISHAGETIPNLVIVPVGAGGAISLFSQSGTHLVVDITGYYTDGSAPASKVGLFAPVVPRRLLDTRPDHGVGAGASVDLAIDGGQPISAAVLNVTATEAVAAGYVTVSPAGAPTPLASNVNVEGADQTIPNAVMVGVGTGGAVSLHSQSGTQLVVDLAGVFIAA